ncbi:DUF421 domain-containing protein [Corynebacterium caspium]|uniref:DUF421 domain-containing protein n=1 Tax=Corynebacterium caspium TaxID=234828 RepID=UPI00035EBF9E|nr:YetF domain-containing protein [Corynebacterium caspium]WKD58832.1 hypothetical protein CCASP_02120 [Corynebacterium caspium DSM 44850]
MDQHIFSPEEGWGAALIKYLGIEPWRIPIVIISAVGIYAVLYLLVRVFGARVLSTWGLVETLVVVMCGAVAGRVIIGHPPTLAAGAIGLCTLVLLEIIFGALKTTRMGRWMLDQPPILILAHGEFLDVPAAKIPITLDEVYTALRKAGIGRIQDVQAIIVEPTGTLSILRAGTPIEAEVLRGVRGAHRLFTHTPHGKTSTGDDHGDNHI